MKLDSLSKTVLITGASGFTGAYIREYLIQNDYRVICLECDLRDRSALFREVANASPDYVIHLAAISFAGGSNFDDMYSVNVVGTENLLDAVVSLTKPLLKMILVSSAAVYGNAGKQVLSESLTPKPVNHYGCSKLAMEHMAQNYLDQIPILITRPFNYTGCGHGSQFVIPKIVAAYKNKQATLELGNLDVFREFNDIRDISKIYLDLLLCRDNSLTVNVCSGRVICLKDVLSSMKIISSYQPEILVNPNFVRANEIMSLSGDRHTLDKMVNPLFSYKIEDTLSWMYGEVG